MLNFVNWGVFTVLLLAGLVGAVSVRPLNKAVLNTNTQLDCNIAKSSNASVLEWGGHLGTYAAIISAALIFGFYAIERLGIVGAPFLEMWLAGSFENTQLSALVVSCLIGIVMGAVFSPLSLYRPGDIRVDFYKITLWKRLIAGVFHGGIVEELLFRWCVLSLIIWLFSFVFGRTYDPATDIMFWAGNFISALLFGVAHLPGSAAAAPLTPMIAIVVVALNVLVGLVCGYVFWVYGIEAAILAHMFTHIGMQPCTVLLRHLFISEIEGNNNLHRRSNQ